MELCQVVDILVDNDPQRVGRLMRRNVVGAERLRHFEGRCYPKTKDRVNEDESLDKCCRRYRVREEDSDQQENEEKSDPGGFGWSKQSVSLLHSY